MDQFRQLVDFSFYFDNYFTKFLFVICNMCYVCKIKCLLVYTCKVLFQKGRTWCCITTLIFTPLTIGINFVQFLRLAQDGNDINFPSNQRSYLAVILKHIWTMTHNSKLKIGFVPMYRIFTCAFQQQKNLFLLSHVWWHNEKLFSL